MLLWRQFLMEWKLYARDRAAMFWTFAFPVLMTCALGLAFRAQAPRPVPIGVAAGEGREAIVERLRHSAEIELRDLSGDALERALRSGGVHLSSCPRAP